MTHLRRRLLVMLALFAALLVSPGMTFAKAQQEVDPDDLIKQAVKEWLDLIEPSTGAPARSFTAKIRITRAEGLAKEADGATAEVAYQAPDRLRLSAVVAKEHYALGRDQDLLWTHEPDKKFAVLGRNGVPRFKADPSSIENVTLPAFALPISRLQIRASMLLMKSKLDQPEKVGDDDCHVLNLEPILPSWIGSVAEDKHRVRLWLRQSDRLPRRIVYTNDRGVNVRIEVDEPAVAGPLPEETWRLKANPEDNTEVVALSHLARFIDIAPKLLKNETPTLGPAKGRRELIAKSGKGRLEMIDGTKVLFLKGSPEEMGKQHGKLLKEQVRDTATRVLYGVGVGSSFAKGTWFFGEIEGAQARLEKHMDSRYTREMDALAQAAGLHPQEGRLSNFFPELFHCTGFALMGKATADGHIYHGRVLDYMRGIGLETNAVVIVHQPDEGRNAWINLSYAGFVGSVTAMNEKGISIGEMGGRGAGNWDGMPMAQLMREVMEKAGTLEEAVDIMRKTPRTCEYYYVIADGKTKTAVGIGATPEKFEVIKPGEFHERLPTPVEDTVLLSAGDRYEELVRRVKSTTGKFDADSARNLMTRPVCMSSNIQSVLFRPDTLDLWVANADAKNVASNTRYTKYNLKDLLKTPAAEAGF